MDIAVWLRKLGLERYAQAFQENEIDAEILPKLNADDLKDIGVAAVGHRRKLLEAIAALVQPASTPPAELSAPAESALRWRAAEAERRQLTVLFCDLVGSTELSARLDPEDMSTIIRAYQNAVAGEITRFEGHIAKYMGDGVLAYFGYPKAHEDEAERAVRAALALADTVGRLATPAAEPLAARVGIATGLVVVGELIGEGSSEEQAVVGETPNLASRLQALAEPGGVVIAATTRRLLGELFELADLGAPDLKGFAEPVAAFAVKGERTTESRFEARRGHALLPMVGRDQELALLLERWVLAKAGEGQGVLLVGEAGIGKSRITRALLDAVAEQPHTRIRYQCSPYHADSALWPVIRQLSHAAGIVTDDPVETNLDRLEALLGQAGNVGCAASLVADLLGLDGSSRYGALNLVPQAQRARTLEALAYQPLGLADSQPVLVVLEDAHWVDPTTLELIEQCLARIAAARVLMLLTSRPERQPELAAHPHVTQLTLNRLGRAGVQAIVTRLWAEAPASGEMTEEIIARADGVPLFVEELTKAVLETGEATIPASLSDSLMARLDRIPEVKEVAQIAACIGREFDPSLLAAIANRSEPNLQAALDRLTAAELIFARGIPPDARYTFKHALLQDAAYQSLLKSKRRQLHAHIAEALEELSPKVSEIGPEVMARHFTDAGLGARAIPYWRQAGESAAARFANQEAIAHLSRGLELVEALPESPDRDEEELSLRVAMGGSLIATKGYPSPEVERNYSRASALCERLGRSAELIPVLRGLWSCYLARGELRQALDLAERLVLLPEAQDAALRAELTGRALGPTLLLLGRLTEASDALDQGVTDQRSHAPFHGEHPGVFSRSYSGWALWFLGFPERAVATIEAGLAMGQRDSHAFSHAVALGFAAFVYNWRGEFVEGRKRAEAAIEAARERHLPLVLAFGTIGRGAALRGLGQEVEGIEQLRTGLCGWTEVGAHVMETQWLGFVAEAQVHAGRFAEALAALDRAGEIAAANGECHYQAELLRLRGGVLMQTGEDAEAAVWLQRAIHTAQCQQAKSLELRAATSLARLWAQQGRGSESSALLVPVYDWFTEGFDTADLREAKALLDELG